ncbi:hypothetical protein ACFR9U_16825 [Halorientalis brevis]|uniref:Lipoprotein n=1 Tax=Halorientalis brevis TaxID=1126241 RepID=A0ABD6CEH3_9EURY|nr:hypothetical protein [Halorientalis brevis]
MTNKLILWTVVLAVLFAGCTGGVVDEGESSPTTEQLPERSSSYPKTSTETVPSAPATTSREPPATQTPDSTATAILGSDNDFLGNTRERRLWTDPTKKDTDGDSLTDYREFRQNTTDPTKADADGDSLNDSAELNEYSTNSAQSDTDGDGSTTGPR